MKTLALFLCLAVSAFAAPPAAITATDVPDTVSFSTPAAAKAGIAVAYNAAALAEYNALSPAQQAAYTGPSGTVTQWIRLRFTDVVVSYQKQAITAEVAGERVEDKWPSLTQTQRNQIKAILATVP